MDPVPDEIAPRKTPIVRGRYRLLTALALLFASSPFLYVASLIGSDYYVEWSHRVAFDSERWKASLNNDDDEPIRIRMIDDLLRKHPLEGMSKQEVANLLGTPPPTAYFRDYPLVYWLGPERGFMSMDSEWLAIRFDANDRVSDADVVRD